MKSEDPISPPDPQEPAAKSAPPLRLRAPSPRAIRLRKPVIQALVASAAILLSGALVWAFFIQPALRDDARMRRAEAGQPQTQGAVRPSEVVTTQPATYDRLPPPRPAAALSEAEATTLAADAHSGVSDASLPARPLIRQGHEGGSFQGMDSLGPRTSGEAPGVLAIRSTILFEDPDGSSPLSPSLGAPDDHSSLRRPPRTIGGQGSDGLKAPLSPYELKAGATVPAVLLTAMDTSRAGPVVAVVTQNVYDTVTGTYLLLPQGSRLIGTSGGDTAYGESRAFIVWDRLILPNGKSLLLGGEPGVDAQGSLGVRGQVDRRIGSLLVGTLFAGAMTTLGQMARDGQSGSQDGFVQSAGDAAAIEASRVGGRLVDRELQVRTSIRLQAGSRVAVLLTRDLVLERYAP